MEEKKLLRIIGLFIITILAMLPILASASQADDLQAKALENAKKYSNQARSISVPTEQVKEHVNEILQLTPQLQQKIMNLNNTEVTNIGLPAGKIKKHEKEVLQLMPQLQKKVNNLAGSNGTLPQTPQLQQNVIQLNSDSHSSSLKDIQNKYLFVSWSMPKELLKNMAIEAKSKQVTLVVRGFKENSVPKTLKTMLEFVKETGSGISIYPHLFKEYEVTSVPTLVVLADNGKYNKISGALALEYSLQKLTQEGEK